MSREARIFAEGALRWTQASGTGGPWNTASAAATALVGFVQVGLSFNSARNIETVMDRGIPHHHKNIGREAIEVQFTYLQAVTANMANPATASGASTPQAHFELKYNDDEAPTLTGQYFQFTWGVMLNRGFTDAEKGNQLQETWRFLSMVGPTGSGYMA